MTSECEVFIRLFTHDISNRKVCFRLLEGYQSFKSVSHQGFSTFSGEHGDKGRSYARNL